MDPWTLIAAAALVVLTPFGGGAPPVTPPASDPPAPDPSSVAPTSGYRWPMDPRPNVVHGFQAPPDPWAPGHRGADLAGAQDQRVLAAGAGEVVFSGVVAGVPAVSVRHANGWRTTYQPVRGSVPVGTTVTAGTTIGTLRVNGSHCVPQVCLHWGLLVGPDTYRDPLTLLVPAKPPLPILVPMAGWRATAGAPRG